VSGYNALSSQEIKQDMAGHWWFTPVIPATQAAEIRGITVRIQPRKIVRDPISKKKHHKKGLVEWVKV
jgi:hypothetical protein